MLNFAMNFNSFLHRINSFKLMHSGEKNLFCHLISIYDDKTAHHQYQAVVPGTIQENLWQAGPASGIAAGRPDHTWKHAQTKTVLVYENKTQTHLSLLLESNLIFEFMHVFNFPMYRVIFKFVNTYKLKISVIQLGLCPSLMSFQRLMLALLCSRTYPCDHLTKETTWKVRTCNFSPMLCVLHWINPGNWDHLKIKTTFCQSLNWVGVIDRFDCTGIFQWAHANMQARVALPHRVQLLRALHRLLHGTWLHAVFFSHYSPKDLPLGNGLRSAATLEVPGAWELSKL